MKFSAFSLLQWPEDRGQGDVFRDEIEQLCEADAQGYYCAWLAEHPFSHYGTAPAIHLNAAHLAARTKSIKIGTAITLLPFMHPLRVAEEVAMLDILSEGRVLWGAGHRAGGHAFSGVEAELSRCQQIFYEQLEVIEQAWTGEAFLHDGEFFQIPELQCFPEPVQRPGPPIYIAALTPSTLEWASRKGHRILADQFSPDSKLAENRRRYLEHPEASDCVAGQSEIPTLRHVYVGETVAKAREEAAAGLLGYYRSLFRVDVPAGESDALLPENDFGHRMFGERGFDPDKDPEEFLQFLFDRCAIVGDAAYCRERIAELRESIGLEHLIAWQTFGDLSHEQSMASQRRLIEDVAPSFA